MAKEWKKVQRADSDFSGNVTGKVNNVAVSGVYTTSNKPTKTDVGLGNLDNTKFSSGKFIGVIAKADGTAVFDPSTGDFTGKIDGETAANIKTKATAGNEAKDAVDGNKTITMVGGSLSIGTPASGVYPFAVDTAGNLKIKNDEFQALADGTVNCKGNFTINQDSNGDSRIVLVGDGTGTAEVEVQGANPTFDLGGASPLGTSTLFIKRGGTNNQARINFRTGSGATTFAIGNSNNSGINDQFAIATRSLWSSGTAPERALSFDADGKMGMYANSKTVAGFTFGSDGTNKHVYIKDGGLGIGTTSISDDNLNVAGTVTASSFTGGSASSITDMITCEYSDISAGSNRGLRLLNTSGTDQQWNITAGVTGSENDSFCIRDTTANTNALIMSTSSGNATFSGNVTTGGNVFVGNTLTVDGGDAEFYNDVSCQGTIDAQGYTGDGSGLSDVVPGNNTVTLAKMADNSIRVPELDTNNSPSSGQTLAYVSAGTGLSWINPVDKCDWQWNARWYTRYDDYFYPNSSYGMNEHNWSTSSSSAKTSWLAYHMPPFVAPFAFTLRECYLRGAPSSSQTFEFILKKGTPSWANSSAATSISNITSGSSLETLACTSGRKNELGRNNLSVSVAKGDILVPQLRRTTSNTSSYYYFLGVFSIVGDRTI